MQKTLDFISKRIGDFKPEIGLILGSGLGDFADGFKATSISYSEIPGFEASGVQGHAGKLIFCEINGKKIVMMQGRNHFYEGHSMDKVVFPIKVMKRLGIKKLIITNAAGSINKKFKPADLMLITDHINFLGTNPLIGPNDESLGLRFPDMSEIYKRYLIDIAKECAKELKITLRQGVYMACTGPSYETPAEIRAFRTLGADAVGMSTVPEAIVANYCKIDVLGISCLCNYAAGVIDQLLSHEEVIESANLAKGKFKALILKILEKL